jgi:hypothetical protein
MNESEDAAMPTIEQAKLEIIRFRPSVTQGEVTLRYDGVEIGRYGDKIEILRDGDADGAEVIAGWAGLGDSYWANVAAKKLLQRAIDGLRATELGNGHFAFEEDRGWRIADTEAMGLWSYDGYGDWVGSYTIKVDAHWWTPATQFAYRVTRAALLAMGFGAWLTKELGPQHERAATPEDLRRRFQGGLEDNEIERITVDLDTGEEILA